MWISAENDGPPLSTHKNFVQLQLWWVHPPIPVAELSERIDILKAQDGMKFSQEYESIETWSAVHLGQL